MNRRRIWIDLDNSPHVPFFAPIIDRLRSQGHEVVLTSRDNAQVRELVELHGLQSKEIGQHFGRNRIAKILGTTFRSMRLMQLMWKQKVDLALSHGSRSQLMAASFLRIPTVGIFDYEFTSSNIRPTWLMGPEAISESVAGINPKKKFLRYPGIKEDVYVSQFRPDLSLRQQLGLGSDDLVVIVRPPASEAHYHNPMSDQLLQHVIAHVTQESRARIVLLPRTKNQATELREEWAKLIADGKIVVPEHVVDGLNLIWNSDLVISGGGTMNREAAALGVPVYSIFRGPLGAVDRYLAAEGRLVLLENESDVYTKIKLVPRPAIPAPAASPRLALATIMANLATILES